MSYALLLFSFVPVLLVALFHLKGDSNKQIDEFWKAQKWDDSDALYLVITISVVQAAIYILYYIISEKHIASRGYFFVYGNFANILTIGIAGLLIIGRKQKRLFSAIGFSKTDMFPKIAAGIGFLILYAAFESFILYAFGRPEIFFHQADDLLNMKFSKWPFIHAFVYLIGLIIVNPLIEEFVFRGMFYGVYLRKFGGVGSIIFISLIWSICHMQPDNAITIFLIGMYLTTIYKITKSIIPCFIVHSGINASTYLTYLFLIGRS